MPEQSKIVPESQKGIEGRLPPKHTRVHGQACAEGKAEIKCVPKSSKEPQAPLPRYSLVNRILPLVKSG